MGAEVAAPASGPPLELPPGRLEPAEVSGGAGSADDDDPPQQQLPMSAAGAGGEGGLLARSRAGDADAQRTRGDCPGGRRGNLFREGWLAMKGEAGREWREGNGCLVWLRLPSLCSTQKNNRSFRGHWAHGISCWP